MASVNLTDVLGAPQLCGTIQGVKTGVPDVFPPAFYQVDKTVERDIGSYFRTTGTRTTARMVAYGGPSVARTLKDVEEVPVKLIHTAENTTFPMADFRGLLKKDSAGSNLTIDQKGVDEIGRQVREARKNVDNLKVSALTSAIFKGAIYFDGKGNLLPSSSGAKTTVDFAVPSGNQGTLNWDGNGAIITAWTTTTVSINNQLIALKQAARKLTGYGLKYAFYGKNVPNLLITNTTLKDFFIRAGAYNGQFLAQGDIPNPLMGFTWVPAYESFFEDQNGTIQSLVGDNQIAFTPEPSLDWIGWLNGTYDVPTALTVSGDAVEALGNVMPVSGEFAYSVLNTDPLSIKMVYGTTTIPVIKVPKSIFFADVG
jgi:hypothetical protein